MDATATPATEVRTVPQTIERFATEMIYKYGELNLEHDDTDVDLDKVGAETLASEFSEFFELTYPLTLEQLISICQKSGFTVGTLPEHVKPRGYNFTYGKDVRIYFKESDPVSGKIHTILHEIYEVLERNLSIKARRGEKRNHKASEANANKFAAYVHVPLEKAYAWINRNGFDVFGFKDLMTCSYATALIIMNEVLCRTSSVKTGFPISMISLLYDRPYWRKTSDGRTPRLELRTYTKSKGFPFCMSRKEISELEFAKPTGGVFTIKKIVKIFTLAGQDRIIPCIEMTFREKKLPVDVLIRTVQWNKNHFRHTAKILIHIMPSEDSSLLYSAERLHIPKFTFKNQGIET